MTNTQNTHDNGRMFGWDGMNMWTEPTLGDAPVNPRHPCGCVPSAESCPYCWVDVWEDRER